MKKRMKLIVILTFFVPLFILLICFHGNKDEKVKKPASSPKTTKISREEQKKEKVIKTIISRMTLEEKVGQLFFAKVPCNNQLEDIKTYHLGGYILFTNDYQGLDLAGVKSLTSSFQEVSKIPMIIGSDEEGGTVTRISSILETPFESPLSLYQGGGIDAIVSDSESKARLLKSVGIQTGLCPVADIASNDKSFIYDRTIGQNSEITSEYISKVVSVFKKEQFGSTLKHFPGYGDNGDSHTSIIKDNRSLSDLQKIDFLPFEAGIRAGADSVLVSHNILTQIDDVPSSISAKINGILRKELGFKGVIMTDDLDMAGLSDFVNQDEAAYRVLTAGNDLIMGSSYQIQVPYLLGKVASGELTEKRIDQSVNRVLSWKYDLGLLADFNNKQ